MSPAELDTLVQGAVELAAIGAAWSLLFFGKVKVSSPPAPKAATAPKPDAASQPELRSAS